MVSLVCCSTGLGVCIRLAFVVWLCLRSCVILFPVGAGWIVDQLSVGIGLVLNITKNDSAPGAESDYNAFPSLCDVIFCRRHWAG